MLDEIFTLINERSNEEDESVAEEDCGPSLTDPGKELESASVSDTSDWIGTTRGTVFPAGIIITTDACEVWDAGFHTHRISRACEITCASFLPTFRLRGGTLTLDAGQGAQRLCALLTRGLQI